MLPETQQVIERDAVLAVARAVGSGDTLPVVLDAIAAAAVKVAQGRAASILLIKRFGQPFVVGGAAGLGKLYRDTIEHPTPVRFAHRGWLAVAVETREYVVIRDTESDPRFAPWRSAAQVEGFRAIITAPLLDEQGRPIGALDVYREKPGDWPEAQLALVLSFADHASVAVRTARLIQQQREQLAAQNRLVKALREQRHEHANRLYTIGGLLALDEIAEARAFINALTDSRHLDDFAVTAIRPPALQGLIASHASTARQRGIEITLRPRSRLSQLPAALGVAGAVTVLGNLIDNAMDAVAEMDPDRRRIELGLSERTHEYRWEVRDFGVGIAARDRARIFDDDFSSKQGHPGIGLGLVKATVENVGGTLAIRRHRDGTRAIVRLPRLSA